MPMLGVYMYGHFGLCHYASLPSTQPLAAGAIREDRNER